MPHKLKDVIDPKKAGAASMAENFLDKKVVIIGFEIQTGLKGDYALINLADGHTVRTSSAIVIRQLKAIDPESFTEGVEATMVKQENFYQLV